LQHQNDALTKQIGDLAFKISQGAAAAPTAQGDAGTQATPQADQPEPAAPPPPPNKHRPAEVALREGNAAIARRDYPAAAEAAHEVLANGHGTHLAEASLLLARAEGGLHQYHQAAADYFQAFKHAPQAPGAPVALLGMAFSFIGEHKNADACQALALLNKQFPHPPAVIKANAAAAHRGAGCK
jgi:TolA-binding protein